MGGVHHPLRIVPPYDLCDDPRSLTRPWNLRIHDHEEATGERAAAAPASYKQPLAATVHDQPSPICEPAEARGRPQKPAEGQDEKRVTLGEPCMCPSPWCAHTESCCAGAHIRPILGPYWNTQGNRAPLGSATGRCSAEQRHERRRMIREPAVPSPITTRTDGANISVASEHGRRGEMRRGVPRGDEFRQDIRISTVSASDLGRFQSMSTSGAHERLRASVKRFHSSVYILYAQGTRQIHVLRSY